MIAWSFRRLRQEMVATAVALVAIGLVALVTGRAMYDTFTSGGLSECLAGATSRRDCNDLLNQFDDKFNGLQVLIFPLILLPALFGAFVGGPLVAREVEAGTHRFLWTQSVTRQRWLASSSGAAMVFALVVGVLYSLIAWAWLDVTNTVTGDRFSQLYDFQGVLPIGATLMAAAFGVLAGTVLRRTVPAIATTVGAFIAVRLFVAVVVRPRLMSPVVAAFPIGPDTPVEGTGAWILSEKAVDAAGHVYGEGGSLNVTGLAGKCPSLPAVSTGELPPFGSVEACLRELGVHSVVKYQPGDRFWTFQLMESGILVALGAVALGLAFVAIRRRSS